MPLSSLAAWLDSGTTKEIDGQIYTLILRVVWVRRDKSTMQMNLPERAFRSIVDSFDLSLAAEYSTSTLTETAEITYTSKVEGKTTNQRSFAFSFHPKLAAIWSRRSRERTPISQPFTNIIVLANGGLATSFRDQFKVQWEANVMSHVMFPLFLCGMVLSQDSGSKHNAIKAELREVESRTGYHRFATRSEPPATGDLGELSARMSGSETKLAGVTRKLKTVEEICAFMEKHSCSDPVRRVDEHHDISESNDTAMTGDEVIRRSADLLKERVRAQTVENERTMQRVRTQINAVRYMLPVLSPVTRLR